MTDDKILKLEITSNKLIDFLMHAATREDIARLDAKNDQLHAFMREDFAKLDAKLNSATHTLDSKIDAVEHKLEIKIDNLEQRLNIKFDKIDTKHTRLLIGIILSIIGPYILRFVH